MFHISLFGQGSGIPATSSSHWVNTVDALCGSGKSWAAIERVVALVLAGQRVLIAGPTLDQSRQFLKDLHNRLSLEKNKNCWAPFSAIEINAETVRDTEEMHVAKKIVAALTENNATIGRAICITHSAALHMASSAATEGWHLIIDEAPAVVLSHEITLPSDVAGALRFRQASDGMRLDAAALDREVRRLAHAAKCARMAGNAVLAEHLGDPVTPLRELHRRIASGHWHVLTRADAVEIDPAQPLLRYKLRQVTDAHDTRKVHLASVIDWPAFLGRTCSRWQSVTILAANIADSFAGQTLGMQGVEMRDDEELGKLLRYRSEHPNGERLTLLYASGTGRLSKRKRDTTIANTGETFGQVVGKAIVELFANKPFAWAANATAVQPPSTEAQSPRMTGRSPRGASPT